MGHPEDTVSEDATNPAENEASESVETPEEPVQDVPEEAPAPVELSEEDKLRAQVAELQGRLREVSKAFKDREAEMEAFRERQKAAGVIAVEHKVVTIVKAFFDPVQNLKRSIDAGGDDAKAILDGLSMVHGQFVTAMERLGLTEVPGVGSEFDPNAHEALAVMPVQDPEQDGKIIVVHTTGYMLRGKAIQPAQVVIGKYTAPAEA